jgi:O-antigen/teichoic acid export membrane protein
MTAADGTPVAIAPREADAEEGPPDTPEGRRARVLRVARSRTSIQTVVYFASNGLVSLLVAISTALLARNMSTVEFGSYSFAISFLLFTAIFFDFGLFLPASRMIAKADEETKPHIFAASLVAYAPVGVAYCLSIAGLSFVVDGVFNVEAGEALLLTAPLAFVYPFALIAGTLGQGTDRLHVFSITSAAAQIVFMVLLLGALLVTSSLSVTLALVLRAVGFLVGCVAFVAWLRPRLAEVRRHVREIMSQARSYGFEVYVGRLLSIGTYQMDVLMLAALTNARAVGLYTLAGAVARVVGLPIYGFASALFPKMAREGVLDRRWIAISWAVGLTGAVIAWVLAKPFIEVVFSERYTEAATYLLPLALAEVVRAVTTVYNSFLSAQALGRELRNAGLLLTVSNVVLNLALIPPFGAMGAAIASLIALLVNLAGHIYYYRRHTRGVPAAAPAPETL